VQHKTCVALGLGWVENDGFWLKAKHITICWYMWVLSIFEALWVLTCVETIWDWNTVVNTPLCQHQRDTQPYPVKQDLTKFAIALHENKGR
jgi:hypothetical protein